MKHLKSYLTSTSKTTLICLSLSLLLSLSSCTNNFSTNASFSNTVQVPPPNSGTGTSNTGTFTLSRVIQDTLNPTALLDLIGDGTGAFGTLCAASASPQTPTCQCSYTYNSASAPHQQKLVNVAYQESDLVRCPYNTIPLDVTQVTISLYVIGANTYSTSVNFNLSTTGISLDTANVSNFISPTKYQCRDIIWIPYLFDGGNIYDPFQSEDPHLTFPLDFYATNLGAAISLYTSGPSAQNYICPPILNPDAYLTPAALTAFNSAQQTNLNVYSQAPLEGDYSIYPPTPGTFDRSTFYLAKNPSGVFNVPVNAYLAPGITSSTGSNAAPLGYGASPIPNGIGTGQETCPDTSIPIPSGYQWVKVWLFRAGLPQRHYATIGQSPNLLSIQSISCNPGDWSMDKLACPTMAPIFPGCYVEPFHRGTGANYAAAPLSSEVSISMNQVNTLSDPNPNPGCKSATTFAPPPKSPVVLADRVYANAMSSTSAACVRLQSYKNPAPGTGGVLTMNDLCSGTSPGSGCFTDAEGNIFDRWIAEDPGSSDPLLVPLYSPDLQSGCSANPINDPLNVCSTKLNVEHALNVDAAAAPTNYNTATADLDIGTATSRYDFLFIVTPTAISINDMQNQTNASLQYTPFRYFTNKDCPSSNPVDSNCLVSNQISYGVKLHDVGSNGDAPPSTTNPANSFPVCALQPLP